MKTNLIVAAVAAAATWMAAGTAQAGGIIVDLREPTVRHHVFTNDNVVVSGSLAAAAAAGSGGSGSTGGSGSSDTGTSELGKKPPAPINPHEILQIQAGLITEEEAMSGCGGASAATGPASLLPMVVAGAALLRRRRK